MTRIKMIARIVADQRCHQRGRQQQLISQDHLIKGEGDNQDKKLGLKTLKEKFVVDVLK